MKNKKIFKIYSIKNLKTLKSYTVKERMEYLKKLSSHITDEIFKSPDKIFPNEIEILAELLKIEIRCRFN